MPATGCLFLPIIVTTKKYSYKFAECSLGKSTAPFKTSAISMALRVIGVQESIFG